MSEQTQKQTPASAQEKASGKSAAAEGGDQNEPQLSGEEVSSRIQTAVRKTKEQLTELQKQLQIYDENDQASASVKAANEKASEYMKKTIDEAKVALDELSVKTQSLRDHTAEIPVKALSRAIATVSKALDRVKELAHKYDEKYQVSTKVLDAVNPAREQAMKYLAEASDYTSEAASAANARLQGVNDGIKGKIKEFTEGSVHFLIKSAAGIDKKHDISTKLASTAKDLDEKLKISETAKNLDEKFHIQEKTDDIISKAKQKGYELDKRLTNGKYTPLVQNAYNDGVRMVSEGLERLQTEFEEAKHAEDPKATTESTTKPPVTSA